MRNIYLAFILVGLVISGCTQPEQGNPDAIASNTPMPTIEPSATATIIIETAAPTPSPTITASPTPSPTAVASPTPAPTEAKSNEVKPIPTDAYRKVEFLQIGDLIYIDSGIGIRLSDVGATIGQGEPIPAAFEIFYPGIESPDTIVLHWDYSGYGEAHSANGIYLKLLQTAAGLGKTTNASVVIGPLSALELDKPHLRITPVNPPETQ